MFVFLCTVQNLFEDQDKVTDDVHGSQVKALKVEHAPVLSRGGDGVAFEVSPHTISLEKLPIFYQKQNTIEA